MAMTARYRRYQRNRQTYRADNGREGRECPGMETPRQIGRSTSQGCGAPSGTVFPHRPRAGIARKGGRQEREKETMAESYNGYCVKCKDKRDFDGDIAETNGRRMAKGTCPVCGTRMNRILGKA